MVRPAGKQPTLEHSTRPPWPWTLYSLVNLEAISALHRLGAPVSRFTTLYSLSHSVQRPPCQKSSLSGVMSQKFETRYSQSSALPHSPLPWRSVVLQTPPISLPSAMKENLGVTMWFCSSLRTSQSNYVEFCADLPSVWGRWVLEARNWRSLRDRLCREPDADRTSRVKFFRQGTGQGDKGVN